MHSEEQATMSFGFSVGDFLGVIEKIHHIRKVFVGAPAQFRFLHDELRTLSIVIMDVETHSPNNSQKEKLEHIVQQCNNVITDIRNTIERYQEIDDHHSLQRPWKKVKLVPEDVRELRDRVHGIVKSLDVINGQITQGSVQQLVKYKNDEQRLQYLDWLSPARYATDPYENAFGLHQPGTGRWFIESTEFQEWVAFTGQTLFCPGIPGAGKTILSSVVIDELESRFANDPTVGIAYVFCSFKFFDDQRQSPEYLMASMLRQLVQNRAEVPEAVVTLYDKHRHKGSRPSFHELSETLKVTVGLHFSRTFFVLDALDECKPNSISSTLREIFRFQSQSNLNILATSRDIPEIQAKFESVPMLKISATKEDVKQYLNATLDNCVSCVLTRRPELRQKAIDAITGSVKGMFLLARLYLESLMAKDLPKEIISELQKLSYSSSKIVETKGAADEAYDQVMDRICQHVYREKLAKDTLSWIVCAKRPLTTTELRTALAVKIGESALDQDNIYDIEDIVASCAGLVTIASDGTNEVVQLAHYTMQEYFLRRQNELFPVAHQSITMSCLTYLSFGFFEHGMCSNDIEYEARLAEYPLYSYAARYWGYHARMLVAVDLLNDLLLSFLKNTSKFEASIQAHFATKSISSLGDYSQRIPFRFTPFHIAAKFGLEVLINAMIKGCDQSDIWDSMNRSPLTWAVYAGHSSVVRKLLDHGVDARKKDFQGQTPISIAASRGYREIIGLLLDYGIDPNSRDVQNQTPLIEAAYQGHHDVVELLLERGADPNLNDDHGKTPLIWACVDGSIEMVLALLKYPLDLSYKDKQGMSAFSYAIEGSHTTVAHMLRLANGQEEKVEYLKLQPDSSSPRKCALCKDENELRQRCRNIATLKRHILAYHFPRANFKCVYCNRLFPRSDQAVEHISSVHDRRAPKMGVARQDDYPCPPNCPVCQIPTDSWDSFVACIVEHSTIVIDDF